MNFEDDKQINTRLSQFLSAADRNIAGPDKKFLDKLREKSTTEFLTFSANDTKKSQTKTHILIWRMIMKSNKTKLAAAALIIIVALISLHYFNSSFENVAFADIIQNIRNTRTITWQRVFIQRDQELQAFKVMVLEPYLMRVESEDGKVWIADYNQCKTLTLDSRNREAVMSSTVQTQLHFYNTFRQFLDDPNSPVRQIGQCEINGVKAIGFELKGNDNDMDVITVWANPQTLLPVRIVQTEKDIDGKIVAKVITTNITFDTELDESLFSLEIPEGYSSQFVEGPDATEIETSIQTASNMKRILTACLIYSTDYNQWPDSLEELVAYGLDRDTLSNPRQPQSEIGFVYIKPETNKPLPKQVVLYEVYDSWGEGIWVGFSNNLVVFVNKEIDFENLF